MIHAVSRKINLGVSVSIDSVTPPSARSDEIDLVELFQKLWQQKLLIIGCTVLVSLCAVAYTFVATPYYEVQSVLRPAPLKELDELNSTGVYELTPEDALKRVGAALDSYSTRANFFAITRSCLPNCQASTQVWSSASRPSMPKVLRCCSQIQSERTI